jgi:hypothetical protein
MHPRKQQKVEAPPRRRAAALNAVLDARLRKCKRLQRRLGSTMHEVPGKSAGLLVRVPLPTQLISICMTSFLFLPANRPSTPKTTPRPKVTQPATTRMMLV